MSASRYIRPDYTERPAPEYFVDNDTGELWQPDVYAEVALIGRRLNAKRIIDVGCGEARKLLSLAPEFELVGLDFGANVARCRERHPASVWIEHDLDSGNPLPLGEAVLRDAVIVCSDVVENLVRPEPLLEQLKRCLSKARALVLTTPERELTWGPDHLGPPPNPCHVREWTIREFAALLHGTGFEQVDLGLTRSNTHTPLLQTIIAICGPNETVLKRLRPAPVYSSWLSGR